MNGIRGLCVLALVVTYCSASADPILAPHVALPHNLPHDHIGVQQVPVTALHHRHHAIPAITLKHHGTPGLAVAHHVAAPVSVAHHVASSVPVASHAFLPSAFEHHVATPLAVKKHAVAPIAVAHHAVSAPVAVTKHVTKSLPGIAVAHHVPSVSISHDHLTPVKSQYHSQDELGQYAFGYNTGTSSRDESRDAYGNVRGSFSYVDSYGKLQTQNYVADDYGFRVTGTNLPVAAKSHRYKRSYGTFPASTGPLKTITHVGPVVRKTSHVVHKTVPAVHHVAPAVHHVAPAVHKVSHVIHKSSPVVHNVAPAVHKVSHVVHKSTPVVHNVAPAVHGVHPIGHGTPIAVGYAGVPQYGYSFHTGPAVSTYRNYNSPAYGYGYH